MTTRTINKELLRALVKEMGIAKIAVVAKCSPSLLQKFMGEKYEGNPTISTIDGLCRATGKTMDELFPVFDDQKESA
jgi:transcriptional regulator with XRE-family HTH domain